MFTIVIHELILFRMFVFELLSLLELNNIKLCDLKVHLNIKKSTCSVIPINLSLYMKSLKE
jgi:hypothetical protein